MQPVKVIFVFLDQPLAVLQVEDVRAAHPRQEGDREPAAVRVQPAGRPSPHRPAAGRQGQRLHGVAQAQRPEVNRRQGLGES